jgi:hypothetical protein
MAVSRFERTEPTLPRIAADGELCAYASTCLTHSRLPLYAYRHDHRTELKRLAQYTLWIRLDKGFYD